MPARSTIEALGVALNAEDGAAPGWVQLLPAGPQVAARDGRAFRIDDPQAVVDAFVANRADLPIDYEHATEIRGAVGEAAPAVGWITAMAVRDGAVWGEVSWTDEGRRAVATRSYRYLSPVFTYDPKTGAVGRITSAALTNQPALEMAALARRRSDPDPKETPRMPSKAICKALGLQDEADDASILAAIEALKDEKAQARAAADAPALDRFVPRQDHDKATARVAELEAEVARRAAAELEAEVDAAVEAGKVTPATRDYHLASCRAEGGLERFRAFVAAAPAVGGKSGLDGATPPGGPGDSLTDEERAACRAAGWSAEWFLAARASQAKKETL